MHLWKVEKLREHNNCAQNKISHPRMFGVLVQQTPRIAPMKRVTWFKLKKKEL